jgi:VanZ family protein
MSQSKQKFSVKFLFLAILRAGIIYYLSSIPDLKSSFSSGIDLVLRKGAHIFAYTILTYLLAKIFDKNTRLYLTFVIAIAIFYAWTDELHQLSVGGRSGSPQDILIDSIGVLGGVVLYRWFRKNK